MEKAEGILRDRGVSGMDWGASIVGFEKYGTKKLGVAIIRDRDGTSNYLLGISVFPFKEKIDIILMKCSMFS